MNTPTISPENFQKNWQAPFFTIFAGQSLSLFGSSLVQFALVWYITRQTGSATILATSTLFAMLPQIIIGPFAGALVDRWDRRLVMIAADGMIAVATLILAGLFLFGLQQIWHIYIILLVRSLGGAFHWPAMSASTSLMVPEKQLARVAGMQQTLQGLVSIVAPPTGAVLIGILSTQSVLMIDVLTALAAILPLLFISIPQPIRAPSSNPAQPVASYWQDLREGFRYVVTWPGLLLLLLIGTLINFLLTPAFTLLPLLVTKYFGRGALELGLTDSLFGGGMIIGGLLLGIWGGFKRRIITSLLGIFGLGLGVVTVGLAPAHLFWVALVGMTMIGLMSPITNGPIHAIIQATVKPEMQGRVLSLINSAAIAMSPISLAMAGPLSDKIGIRSWYLFSGAACLLIASGSLFIPAILNIEKNRTEVSGEIPNTHPAVLPQAGK
jgi:DHA3 family macrolide efflux protein-like MFS transporter